MGIYAFGPFQLDSDRRLFQKAGRQVALTSKAFNILLYFVQNPGRVISRDELLHSCWPGTVVLDSNITNHIFTIRQILSEHPREHRYIVTVPGEGYTFVGEIQHLSREDVGAAAAATVSRSGDLSSVAVLPFRILGNRETRDAHLESGLSDVLVTRLSRIRQLQVRSTSTIPKQYEGKNPILVGRKLGVDALLGGSIQRIGENLRITVQFVRVHDGVVLWAHQFDEKAARLFKVEDSIAEQTLAALRTTLSIEEERQIARSPTASSEAYEDYLKGRYFWNKRTEEAIWTAIGYFEHAIQHDSSYAIAYIGLADSHNLLVFLGTIPTPEGTAKTIASARKALELDPSLGEAHTSIGFAKFCQGAWQEAEAEFNIAQETAPHYATTYHWLSEFLVARGRFDEAVAMVQKARELDPMSLTINANIGSVLYFARQYSRAIEEMKSAQQLDRYFLLTHWYLGLNLTQLGKYDQAIDELETALGLSQGSPLILATLGHAFAVSRRRERALRIINELKQLSARRYVSPYDLAVVYAGLGHKAEALRWLSRAYKEGSNWMAFLNVDPRLDRLRSERAFVALVRKVGLPSVPAVPKRS